MVFKFKAGAIITFGRSTVKFDSDGLYSTDRDHEIEGLKSFEGVEEVKESKPKK